MQEGVWFPMHGWKRLSSESVYIEYWSIKYITIKKKRRADSPSCVFTPRVDVKPVLMDTWCSKTF